jgi:hypothetical protein
LIGIYGTTEVVPFQDKLKQTHYPWIDSIRLKTMILHAKAPRPGSLWEVSRNEDGTFDMLRDGIVLHRAIPDKWLEDQLARYGLCGQEYRDLREQLKTSQTARLDFR